MERPLDGEAGKMSGESADVVAGVVCPKCGEHCVTRLQYTENTYACLKCDFRRDLTGSPDDIVSSGGSFVIAALTVFLLIILL